MRSNNLLRFGLLAGVLVLGTGASTQGVRQAERWQREADLARAGGLWDVAYERYRDIAEVFPGTPHGRMAAARAQWMQGWGVSPDRSAASEDPLALTCELFDLVTWP